MGIREREGISMPIFDIPKDRLVDLSDEDLRTLIALLCEAERERQGGHRNEVRWGGSQTAPDGGIDVRVESTGPFIDAGPLARRHVGIQVRTSNLGPAAITREMRRGGSLRPAISTLAAQGGSYVIASAKANCSESMLQNRIGSMQKAVADDPNGAKLHLKFLDRNAIIRWVSAHPSVAFWLRGRLWLPMLTGWHPFGRWSSTPESESDDLICEDGLVFHFESHETIRKLPVALDEIRNLVRDGTSAVRIAGLSGIGKTRIVQALFEEVESVPGLPKSYAIYTDLGDSPDPAPARMLEVLIERDDPAVLVVDNCPPDIHQALARKLAERPRGVGLITVEYDVRKDRPEETHVIRVEAKGFDVVESLIRSRCTGLSKRDARRLAELAQGNARLGFALARAVPQTGNLSIFEDAVLFDRLFWQREREDPELALAADVLSLVYSFDVDGAEEVDELSFLGSFVGLSGETMYRHAENILGRGLAQARGNWRAILPHALANRLARKTVKSIRFRHIADEFADKPRLRRSLARRLSYLHDCDEARSIVTRWMEVDGPLHGPSADIQTIEAVCHLIPEDALGFIDGIVAEIQQTPRDSLHLDSVTRMIKKIAHSKNMFPRACKWLVSLAIATEEQLGSNADDVLSSLFGLYLSGTMASTETRVQVAQQYLFTDNPRKNSRGVRMLMSALQTARWSSSNLSTNDARPNASGREPSLPEIEEWFSLWLDLAVNAALNGPPDVRSSVRKTLCDKMSGVWRRVATLRTKVEQIARQLHDAAPWAEGWHTLRRMLYFIKKEGIKLSAEDMKSVSQLIVDMAPTDLVTRARAETVRGWDRDTDDKDYKAIEVRRTERLESLGQELADSPDVLRTVGKYLFEREGPPLRSLGTGLGQRGKQPERVWEILRDLYFSDPDKLKDVGILQGFLNQLDEENMPLADAIRDECRSNPFLRRIYAVFLPQGVLSAKEFERVVEIAGENETEAWWLSDLVWRQERALKDDQRVRLLRALLNRKHGALCVINALNTLGYGEKGRRDVWPEELNIVGLDAVTAIISHEKIDPNADHDMADTLSYCLRGDNSALAGRCIDAIIKRVSRRYESTDDVRCTLAELARKSPKIFLCRVFPDGADVPSISFDSGLDRDPLMYVPAEALIAWCSENATRWTKVAQNISPFATSFGDETEAGDNWSLAVEFLNAAPSPEEVVEFYLQHIEPMSWSGSGADIIESRLARIETLSDHPVPEVGCTIARLARVIRPRIARMRQDEHDLGRKLYQRFE